MHIIFVYVIEPHPVGSPSPYSGKEWTTTASADKDGNSLYQPDSYAARLAQATQMKQELGISIPVLVDEMDNAVWCTYGPAPNNAYLIDQDGYIVEKEGWYQPDSMEEAITSYLAGTGNR